MKLFQVSMLSAVVLSLLGVLAEESGRYRYVAMFTVSGALYLAAWTLSMIHF